MFCYNLFLFASLREPAYFWYLVYTLNVGLFALSFDGLLVKWLADDGGTGGGCVATASSSVSAGGCGSGGGYGASWIHATVVGSFYTVTVGTDDVGDLTGVLVGKGEDGDFITGGGR